MLSLSDFHPTSLLLSRVGKVYVWFTHLLGDNGKKCGGVVFMKLLCCSQYHWWFLEKDDSPFLVQLVILT